LAKILRGLATAILTGRHTSVTPNQVFRVTAARPRAGNSSPDASGPAFLQSPCLGGPRVALDCNRGVAEYVYTRRSCGRSPSWRVIDAAQECLDAGTLVADDALTLARLCWATAHGLASLKVNGLLSGDDCESFAAAAFRRVLDAHRPARPARSTARSRASSS
jgi:hypothetical protein